jgi:hypothetical protein
MSEFLSLFGLDLSGSNECCTFQILLHLQYVFYPPRCKIQDHQLSIGNGVCTNNEQHSRFILFKRALLNFSLKKLLLNMLIQLDAN